ncbi:hypothetical protein B0H14DRAFT_2365081, partial [Mycena olivaceomarginata]
LKVINEIGTDRFAAIGSDSTGNTKSGREKVVIVIPTILIVPDPCHHLSNTIGDITRLPYFMNSITKMRTTITHFSHSSASATHLKAMRVSQDINNGLEKVGKTRFGTIYWAGYALIRELTFWLAKVACARAEWLVSGLGLDLAVITSPSLAFRLASQNVGFASHSASLPSAKWLALIAQYLGPYGQILCARYITIHPLQVPGTPFNPYF